MPSCSKAPRGLFVQSWVTRIFTGTSISPGPPSRQRPDRYTIRAGRNLPDKEFRSNLLQPLAWWAGHFCQPPFVAKGYGPYLQPDCSGVWRMVSEDSQEL
jgi:hypothetical protein